MSLNERNFVFMVYEQMIASYYRSAYKRHTSRAMYECIVIVFSGIEDCDIEGNVMVIWMNFEFYHSLITFNHLGYYGAEKKFFTKIVYVNAICTLFPLDFYFKV